MPETKIAMASQRFLLPYVGIILQCLDENQNPIDGAFASGFIRREEDGLYLYTCWHVVTGFNPSDIRIPINRPSRRYLKVTMQGAVIQQWAQSVGGIQSFVLPLYEDTSDGPIPIWLQENQHVPHGILNDNRIFVPDWHDVVKIRLPSNLVVSTIQVIEADRTVPELGNDFGVGTKCLIVGFPYGFSTGGPSQPTPVVLTRFVAGSTGKMSLIMESIGAKGMSGGPVFVETVDEILFFGIYTGSIFPGGARGVSDDSTALGVVVDLRLVIRGHFKFTNRPSYIDPLPTFTKAEGPIQSGLGGGEEPVFLAP
ncbi:MAG: hypothetical protein ABIT37_18535 [Luteolibacter sp.]